MKHSKVLVLSVIIGMHTQMTSVIAMDGILKMVGDTEQQELNQESSISIPVQGYIFPDEKALDPDKPSPIQPGEMSVESITKTGDPLEYPLYGSIFALSLLWVLILWRPKRGQ